MRMLIGTVLALLIAFAGIVVSVWLGQRRLIYLPLGGAPPPARTVLPGAEEVRLATEDGLSLGAWFVTSRAPDRATILVFNGNAGHRGFRAPLAQAFTEAGYGVLLFDYRGYGGNAGSPSEAGLIQDGLAARRWLEGRTDVDQDKIVYYGESLGAAVALAVATRIAPHALILRSPFTSMVEVGRLHYPWLPVRLLLEDRWPSIDLLPQVDRPLLVIAGTRDRIVPFEQSVHLFETARQEAKSFVRLEGVGHNDLELIGDEAMRQTFDFLERHAGAVSGSQPQDVEVR